MTLGKRIFDIVLALLLAVILGPILLGLLVVLLLRQGWPLFYVSERMQTPDRAFGLWKLRSMQIVAVDSGVSGGDKTARITPMGRLLRRTRLDEIPQLWNLLRGDISFVGPRPPLRRYVEQFPELYGKVLQSRPGVTGLATIVFHGREERLLAACQTPEETETVYVTACIPRKAQLDLLYQRNQSVCLDLWLIARTAGKVTGR